MYNNYQQPYSMWGQMPQWSQMPQWGQGQMPPQPYQQPPPPPQWNPGASPVNPHARTPAGQGGGVYGGMGMGQPMTTPPAARSAQGQEGLNIRQDIGNLRGAFAENMRRQGRNPGLGYGNTKTMQYANQATPAVLAQFMNDPSLLESPERAIENVLRTIQGGGNVIYDTHGGRGLTDQMLGSYERAANNPFGSSALDNFLASMLGSGGSDTAEAIAGLMYGGVGGPVGKFLNQNALNEASNADFMWRNPDQFTVPDNPLTYIDILRGARRR